MQLAHDASKVVAGLGQNLQELDRGIGEDRRTEGWTVGGILRRFAWTRKRLDVPLWLMIVHAIAWNEISCSPLSAQRMIWDPKWSKAGHLDLPYDREHRREKLAELPNELRELMILESTTNRFYSILTSDLFNSSLAAINSILDFCFTEISGTALENESQRSPAALQLAPAYQFQLAGNKWHLRYTHEGKVEEGWYQNLHGFHYYAYLLKYPRQEVPVMHLIDRGPPNPSAQSDTASKDPARGDSGSNQPGRSGQRQSQDPPADRKAISAARDFMENKILELEEAKTEKNLSNQEEIKSIITKTQNYLKSVSDGHGNPLRPRNTDERDKPRKSVYGALSRARDLLKPEMSRMHEHLKLHIKCRNYSYKYTCFELYDSWKL